MLFYLASIIIHDLFRTDHSDYNNSKTSSYLDLSPLYGSVQEEQDLMRTHHDGKIKPDCFSEKRLLSFPPGVGALLIMFNRFHNYVVEQLALLNEDKRFNKPEEGDAEKHAKYDEDLFQTGRLVTCGLYVNIILIDYVRTILNLNKTDSNWQLNPRAEIKQGPPMGVGNQVSAEFNLVYRWHSAISDRDERWTKELVDKMFDGKDQKDVGWYDFIKKAHEYESKFSDDPGEREFHGLQRDEHTGSFRDDDLIKILTESIDDCANAFGAQRVPEVMRNIEILGIIQARTWNVATLNEFRKHFNLTPYRKFEEINPDPYVADQLKHLYDHPDRVELYPGLVAEDTKTPMVPGAGLTPSFTVSRAVLSDANTLVRGDRFYTIDYHPRQLTNWGFREVQYDLGIDNGCVFYKLFLRAFPNSFEPNSIYAHYPLTIPTEMRKALDKLDAPDGGRRSKYYDWNRPGAMPQPKMVFTYAAADKILGNQQIYKVTWGKAMTFLMGDPAQDFMLAGDGYKNAESRKLMEKGLYLEGKWEREVKDYYEMITTKLLKEKSYKLAGVNQVDIIRDVGNLAHVHYAADLFALPLKGTGHPHQLFTEHELYLIMAAVFICVFFDLDPANSFPLRQKAHTVTQQFGKIVEATVRGVKHGGLVAWLVKKILPVQTSLRDYGIDLLKRLLQMEPDVNKLVWGNIMGTAGGMVANQGQLFGQTMDYYMDEGREHLPEINRLAKSDDPNDFATLMKYFLEGSRLYGETGVFRYVTEDIEVQDGDRMLKLKPGDRVMVNLKAASRDPQGFPNPDKVDLKRPIDSYIHLGGGPHQCLGLRMTRVALTTMFKVITRLDGLRPAPGPQGRVAKVLVSFGEDDNLPEGWHYHKYLTEDHDSYFPFPCCKLQATTLVEDVLTLSQH